MNAKQWGAAALALTMSMGLAGCGGKTEQTSAKEEPAAVWAAKAAWEAECPLAEAARYIRAFI